MLSMWLHFSSTSITNCARNLTYMGCKLH
uniref:Uncharacterized protein n=1 Tax=Anguilla anguilla TaxID=7936 RepID=A0A0E9S1S9_ANGAN